MRYLILGFLLTALSIACNKEKPILAGTSYWDKTFGGQQEDWAFSILLDQNGNQNLFVFGRSSYGSSFNFRLLQLNSSGAILLDKRYDRYDWTDGRAMVQLADGGLLLAGSAGFFSGTSDAWLVRVDNKGEYIWEKSYRGGSQNYTQSIMQDQEGNFVLSVFSGPESGVIGDMWMFKVDAAGKLLAENTLKVNRKSGKSVIVERPEGGYLLAVTVDETMGVSLEMRVYQLDAQLQVTGQKSFTDNGYVDVQDLILTEAGDYALLGTFDDKSWLLLLDNALNLRWQSIYEGYPRALCQTPDKGFALTAILNDDFLLRKVDSQGTPQWQQVFGGDKEDIGEDIITLPNGGFAIGGITRSKGAGHKDFWVLKLNENGETGNDE